MEFANKPIVEKVLRAENRGIAWFEDGQNRDEALRILKTASGLNEEDIEKAYDFFHNGHYFEPTGKISRTKLQALAKAMESLGDLPGTLDVDKAALPDVTQFSD